MRLLTTFFLLLTTLTGQSQTMWSNPQILFPGTALPSYILDDDDPTGPIIRTAATAEGKLVVVWSDARNGQTELFASLKTGDAFSPPINLSQTPDQESLFPEIVTAPSGATCVAWTEIDPSFETAHIHIRVLMPDGTWNDAFKITNTPNTINAFPSLAYTAQPNLFVLAYTEIMVNPNGDPSGYTIQFREINLQTGTSTIIDPPELSPLGFSFRATLLNQGDNIIHCAWYDAADDSLLYDSYIAYSQLEAGVWTATEALSTTSTITTWDDGPIKMVIDNSKTLYIIWSSFLPTPSNAFIIKKLENEPFGIPTEFHNNEVLNWAYAMGPDNVLHCTGVANETLNYYQFESINLDYHNSLTSPDDGASSFPEMINISDTLHLFWAQGENLIYAYKAVTSTAVEPSPENTMAFVISPNPCRNQLWIDSCSEMETTCQLSLCDAIGRPLIQQISNGQSHLDLSPLPPGTYFLKISAEGKLHTKTVVKQ